jgi:hypothetical protein
MKSVEKYQQRAEKFRIRAAVVRAKEEREELLQMAEEWEALAKRRLNRLGKRSPR